MEFQQIILILITIASLNSTLSIQAAIESDLITSLLLNYNKISRPSPSLNSTLNNSQSVESHHITASIGLTLLQILNVDEKQQILSLNVWQRLSWTDSGLVWNATKYGNISQVRIPIRHLWRPDILVYNIADEQALQSNNYLGSMNAVIYNTGKVIFVPPMILRTTCKMDVTWFPWDSQSCQIILGSWTYPGSELDLVLQKDAFNVESNYIKNGEWRVLGTEAARITKYYENLDPYPTATFTLHIERNGIYYFFNLIVPSALIGFLALLGFTLPPDSGEKLSLGVTVLFSLIVFLNMIAESMPANSDRVPLLGTYFNCVMFMIASSVISTVVVNLNIRSGDSPKQVGVISQTLFLSWLPWILRMKPPCWDKIDEVCESRDKYAKNKEETWNRDILQIENKLPEPDANLLVKRKWMFAAVVVDRLCLVVSIIFIIISTIVLLVSSLW